MRKQLFHCIFALLLLKILFSEESYATVSKIFSSYDAIKSFQIDSVKLKYAFKLIADYEMKLNKKILHPETVIQGVSIREIITDLKRMLN